VSARQASRSRGRGLPTNVRVAGYRVSIEGPDREPGPATRARLDNVARPRGAPLPAESTVHEVPSGRERRRGWLRHPHEKADENSGGGGKRGNGSVRGGSPGHEKRRKISGRSDHATLSVAARDSCFFERTEQALKSAQRALDPVDDLARDREARCRAWRGRVAHGSDRLHDTGRSFRRQPSPHHRAQAPR
jgi:hypothetical protein